MAGPHGFAGTVELGSVVLGDHSKPVGPSTFAVPAASVGGASRFCRHNGFGLVVLGTNVVVAVSIFDHSDV